MKLITNKQLSLALDKLLKLVVVVIFVLSITLLSSYASVLFGLVEIWPVNALLTALVLRLCTKRCMPLYASIYIGLFLGHFLFNSSVIHSFAYSISDFLSFSVALYILQYKLILGTMRTYTAMLKVFLAGLLASLVYTFLIAITVYLLGSFDDMYLLSKFLGQWLGYSAVLPLFLLLHLPDNDNEKRKLNYKNLIYHLGKVEFLTPLLCLLFSYLIFVLIGVPSAIVFILAALLYCAYFYQQLATAVLVFISAIFITLVANNGFVSYEVLKYITGLHVRSLISLQLGMQILVMVPLLVASSLTERNDQIKALNKALDHDDLTKSLSRHAFMRSAAEIIIKTPPAFYGNAVLMLDIDYFKQLNDTHGHAAGDTVLTEFARVISSGIRPDDVFGRLGGEEFGLILPNTALASAIETAERLRTDVQRIELYYDSEEPLRITVSIGIVHDKQMPNNKIDQLLSCADQAMYKAKNSGRNRVLVYETSQD